MSSDNSGFVKHTLIDIRHLTRETFVLRMERKGLDFMPGQNIVLGVDGNYNTRDYSIYSSPNEDYLEVLVREIETGYLTPRLKDLKPGALLNVYGPFGHFILENDHLNKQIYMIASGTGIAPFHSMVLTYKNLDYIIIHGVKYKHESYDREHYKDTKYLVCTSQDPLGDFKGRVTEFIASQEFKKDDLFYLCGNNSMIHDVITILNQKGIKREQLYLEIYF